MDGAIETCKALQYVSEIELEQKKLKRLIDPVLAHALSHPLRGHILVTVAELGEVSPAHVAAELEIPVYAPSYHFKRLRLARLINQVRTEPRRGFTEHFFSLAEPLFYIDDREWGRIPKQFRDSFSGELTTGLVRELRDALRAGTLSAEDAHLSCVWMRADEQAREELREVDREALERKMAIKERCERRLGGSGPESGAQMTLLTASFETGRGRD